MKFLKLFFMCVVINVACFSSEEKDISSFVKTEEDALFLRRMVEFWEEGKISLVQMELEKYLSEGKCFENEVFHDYLCSLLGDVYFTENKFFQAVGAYKQVKNIETRQKVFSNYLQALYRSEKYDDICMESEDSSVFINKLKKDEQEKCYYLIGHSFYKKAARENNKDIAGIAKKYLNNLLKTSLEDNVLEVLTEIEVILENWEIASLCYLKLSKVFEENKEYFLFQSALMQAKFDKKAAIDTFDKVSSLSGPLSSDAAFNKLIILAETQSWEDILLEKKRFEKLLKDDQKKALNFYVIKSNVFLDKNEKAAKLALEYIDLIEKPTKYMSEAFQTAAFLGEKLSDMNLLDKVIEKSEKLCSANEEDICIKARLTRGLLHKKNKDYQKAKSDFEFVEKNHPTFSEEDYLANFAHLDYLTGDFLKSRLRFKSLLQNLENKSHVAFYCKYLINSSIKIVNESTGDKKESAQNVLIDDLEDILCLKSDRGNIFTQDEANEYIFFLAKTKYITEDYDGVLKLLGNHEKTFIDNAEANFLLACCFKEMENLPLFCKYAQKAISLDEGKQLDQKSIRISLYNVYLSLSDEDKAADNLFLAYSIDPTDIDLENVLWVAGFYYNKVFEENMSKDESDFFAKRSFFIFSNFSEELPEREMIKIANLYEYFGETQKQKEVLEKLTDAENKIQEEACFKLAFINKQMGNSEKAKEFLNKIVFLNNRSYFKSVADLSLSRIILDELPKDAFSFDNTVVIQELSRLKNLKLRRKFSEEPVYLEAALEYVDVQDKVENDLAKKIDMLSRLKEEFSSFNDIISKDYQNEIRIYPEKEILLNAYLKYIDLEIFYVKGLKEHNKDFLLRAKRIFEEMENDNLIITSYLRTKITNVVNDIEKECKDIAE